MTQQDQDAVRRSLTRGQPVTLCEVGPRDGLQNYSRQYSVEERTEFVNRLFAAGIDRVEAVSFVNDARVPRMAGAEAVAEGIVKRPDQIVSGLVMNRRGADRAFATAIEELRFVVVASETFSQRNQGASVDQTLEACAAIAADAKAEGKRFSVIVAASFGCPFEGRMPVERVTDIVGRVSETGPSEIVLADTIGAAVPGDVAALLSRVMADHPATYGCHFHNTRNMGIANAAVALQMGVTLFDASLGGMGGCPFAPRATGNIATEELIYMLRADPSLSLPDIDGLMDIVRWLEGLNGEPVPGLLSRAGLFPPAA